jgi:hypothetical protein
MMTNREEMEEKRRIILQDQSARQGSTFKDFADAEFEVGSELGRFRGLSRETQVIGKSPIAYPRLPQNNPWASDPLGPEMPIDATDCGDTYIGEPLGNPAEATSEHGRSPPTPALTLGHDPHVPQAPPASQSPTRGGGAPLNQSKFRRRI